MEQAERYRLQAAQPSHPALRIAMPLVSDHDGDLRCIGTGFLVAPGLAITAAHVVEDWITHQQRRDGYKRLDSSLGVSALYLGDGKIWPWIVDAIYSSRIADIAFLRFARPPWWGDGAGQIRARCARLSFNPPAIGEEIRVFGFPGSDIRNDVLVVAPAESMAIVTQVDHKHDIRMRPAAYLHLHGEIEGGMSGGPCFDKDWNVIGICARGWSLSEGNPLSYAALLWPAMNVEIDLFKTGSFPAIDLFKDGPTRALGYQRVHVTNTRAVHFAKTAPCDLEPLPPANDERASEAALNFAAANAQLALAEARSVLEDAVGSGGALRTNDLLRALRHYFWELDAAIRAAVRLKAVRIGVDPGVTVEWETFAVAWRDRGPSPAIIDELTLLDFAWSGVDLFEIRAYAQLTRSANLPLTTVVSSPSGKVIAVALESCRRRGEQIFLPEGLDRFIDAGKAFVQRLLRLEDN